MSGNALEYILTGFVAVAVVVYLVVALLRPEQF
ncbi:MAG: K(+)-transporting ATPase subunit F [Ktedonobacterales bacterium]|nr:K(+)-transporting ATPase subunit F [Ktedonobacterales bacterium]